MKYNPDELDSVISAAVENAREAARLSASKQNKYVALDIGPLGKLLKPYGIWPLKLPWKYLPKQSVSAPVAVLT